MKKSILLILYIIFNLSLFSEENNEKTVIGIAPPFMKVKNVNTMFFHRQFIFEFLSDFPETIYDLEILSPSNSENEIDYLSSCISQGFKFEVDYIIITKVYSIDENVFFEFNVLNPYNNRIVFSKFYDNANIPNINEFLIDTSEKIVRLLSLKEFPKIKQKGHFVSKKNEDKTKNLVEDKTFYKHEVFVMHGFFKNTPRVMSFLSCYMGYNFTPFNFFNIEASFFFGEGYKENNFSFDNINLNSFYLGGYGSFCFFIPGIVQPGISLRFEVSYIINDIVCFSIPLDLGIKFFVTKENVLRISSSFQFNYLNTTTLEWDKNFIIGIMVGYARKI